MELRQLLDDLFDYRISAPYKLPKKIKYNNEEFCFKDNSYYSTATDDNIMNYVNHTLDLRCQIEIIEAKPKFEIDDNGFIHTLNGSWKGRKMDIEFAKALNYLLEKSDKE